MNSEKIYPLFLQKLELKSEDQIQSAFREEKISDKEKKFRVIISFENVSKRDEFISKNDQLEFSNEFTLIPSICLNLTKEQILYFQEDELIRTIEENQELYLSILDVIESTGLNKYRRSHGKQARTGKEVVIGIIDNGINDDFDTFLDVDIEHHSFYEEKKEQVTHGTLMANIIVNQFLDDNNNIIGFAPDASLIDFDISNPEGKFLFSDVLQVFDYIFENDIKVDVLLISLSSLQLSDGKDILSLGCNFLIDRDIIIVCPAGNFGPESNTIGSPAAADKVITIGSHTKTNQMSYFSGRGPTADDRIKPDFCLPGSKIEIPLSEDIRPVLSGTCVSAAIGTGIIALLKEIDPKMSYIRIFANMKRASVNLKYKNISQGSGTIFIPDVFKKADIKKIKYKTPKVKKIKYKKEEPVEAEVEGASFSYNRIAIKSLVISIQFIAILIIIFYIGYYFDFISRFFMRYFGGY